MPRHACLLIKNAFKNIRLWMLALGCLCPAAAHAAEVVIGGAGAAIGTLQALGAEFSKARANVHINVLPSLGSGGGIKALVAGKLTLAVTARPLTEAERRGGLVEHEIARTPLVIAVSNKSAVSKLSLDELAALYAGRTARWPDGTPVRPVLRPAEDTDTVVLKTFSPAVAQASQAALAREGMLIAITDSDSADALERLPGAFGTAALSTLISEKRALKALAVGGRDPSLKALSDNQYPWYKTIFLVTAANTPAEAVDFVKFVRSPASRAILGANGSLPAAHP